MSASLHNQGRFFWAGERDDEGHRVYTLKSRVRTSSLSDGPQIVMACPGLPALGSFWNFGNDIDAWAYCMPGMNVSLNKDVREGTSGHFWDVEQKFSTRPFTRCQDTSIEDPLLEPPKVNGSFIRNTKLGETDKDDNAIEYSNHEPIRGAQNEWDDSQPTVHIEQNVAELDLATCAGMVDTVNDDVLWGLAARCVKLSNFSWSIQYYGVCDKYYTRVFDFDIAYDTWDREILDEGNKVLAGDWSKNAPYVWTEKGGVNQNNPNDYIIARAPDQEPMKVPLNGSGGRNVSNPFDPEYVTVQYYPESNFLALNIPVEF